MFLFLLLTLGACQIDSPPQKNTMAFFSLKNFFEKEAQKLNGQKINVEKTIKHNGKTETHETEVKSWTEELQLFSESDIAKPSWMDKYKLDSFPVDSNLVLLRYTALDEALETQALDIKLSGSTVHSILIIKRISNPVYESQQYLTYIPNKGYTIEKTQEFLFSTQEEYNIQAKYSFQ